MINLFTRRFAALILPTLWGLMLFSPPAEAVEEKSPVPPVTYRPGGSEPVPPALSIAPIPPGTSPLGNNPAGGAVAVSSPGRVTSPGDLEQLIFIRDNNDPLKGLDWRIEEWAEGRGLEADEKGRLRVLTIDRGGLVGRLSLKGLEALTEFRCRNNPLIDLELADLPALRKVSVNGGELEQLTKNCFSGLSGLSELDLSGNRLSVLDKNSLGALTGLLNLNLSDNLLTRLGRGSFTGLENLAELYLDRNRIAELEWGTFSPLTNLAALQLTGNRLVELDSGCFLGLKGLEVLQLDENRIRQVGREAFKDLKALKYLDMSDNQLTDLNPLTLAGLENLAEVDLEANSLPLGAMHRLRQNLGPETYVYFREQRDVYFSVRVQYLPLQDHYLLPPEDSFINRVPSHGDLMGDEPEGAEYSPAPEEGRPGRVDFKSPGVYQLTLINGEACSDPDAASRTGYFIIVDRCPTLEEATAVLGSRSLVGRLVQGLSQRGYLEAPSSNPKMVSALKALFKLQ